MGCKKAPPITLSANANPPAVFPGEPVTVTATAGSVDPKKNTNVIYNWSGTGASGNGTSTTIQTAALDPGNYSVKADVKEGKKGKEGLKPGQSADASASFTVKPFEPPTIKFGPNGEVDPIVDEDAIQFFRDSGSLLSRESQFLDDWYGLQNSCPVPKDYYQNPYNDPHHAVIRNAK